MLRGILLVLVVAAALTHPGVANARGGGRIPCLSEEVIKVADVPRDAAIALAGQWGLDLKRIRTGYGVDLGYRFDGCSAKGRWVGYIGYSETDFDLDDQQLHQLASAAGLATTCRRRPAFGKIPGHTGSASRSRRHGRIRVAAVRRKTAGKSA